MTMRRFTALVNPISGGGRAKAVWRPVLKRLTGAGVVVKTVTTTGRGHALDQACAAATRGHVVIAVGGDGLVRDVAGGVRAAGGVMGIVPAGRGNDLARLLRIPTGATAVATMLLNAPAKPIDLIEVNGVYVPGNVYMGIDSLATRIINRNRWVPARLLYRAAPAVALLRWRPARYTLVDDTGRRTMTGHTVVVANSGVYGHGLSIVPPARLDDGHLHVMTVGDLPRSAVVSFMRQAETGEHLDRDGVDVHTTTELTVAADRPVPVCADGDEVTELPAVIRSHRHAISVIAPV
ncbi:diacylglycerol kinase family enzyme [Stackebrandtia endophytica]|uniref:Diacylglycerol kinase family enzyme n=2 Tax=Stackebrandtia endophytica TaxID=1496996 RepID=A0A543AVA4_9ACTN|nr:diacylglycerol kinase family enzyme [Stackebrandtia endophytica]